MSSRSDFDTLRRRRDLVLAYHRASKHRADGYAPGPEALDWDAQPAPFRRFDGCDAIPLPRHDPVPGPDRGPAAASLENIAALLRLSLGLSAWKSWGPDRWAVRCNPSSGNLHPVEAYLLAVNQPALADGIYHYRPDDHALELRASLAPRRGEAVLAVGLASVMWREAWKYGLRAFRYCQLDVGHAIACVAQAAALLGWPVEELRAVGHGTLATLLGLDRAADFPERHVDANREEPEVLLAVAAGGPGPARPGAAELGAIGAAARWRGRASVIDRHPMFRWPGIEEVAVATRRGDDPQRAPRPLRPAVEAGAEILLGRRSAQRFDPGYLMRRGDFARLLAVAGRAAAEEELALVIFVHRVEGLAAGLYLLPGQGAAAPLTRALAAHFELAIESDEAAGGPGLQRLGEVEPRELQRVARAVHCHQDIAANACLAFGMLDLFETAIADDPAAYRDRLRAAGKLGQALYLQAEALGLRGTGIGCFFDDSIHRLLGLADERIQTLYHFTLGAPVEDPRIETRAPYDDEAGP